MKRLFLALWPDTILRQKLAYLNESIIDKGLKKVKPHNLHVTLVFIGNVDNSTEQAIRQQLTQIVAKPISIMFDQFTLWTKGGILSLTSSQQPTQLIDLVEQLKIIIEEEGVELDSRPYTAHITLARKARVKPIIVFEPFSWQATQFVLVESVSTPLGVDYQLLANWPLSL